MTRLSFLVACLLASTALCSCASEARSDAKAQVAREDKSPATDLDSGVRQAQLLRLAGHYDEAIHTLSQLMLVASDDARVVGEYGKTLAQMGRAKEATQFLTRAVELSPRDWTLYSALGVAYDENGEAEKASGAYRQALVLKPEEPSILNNFALSRLMAADPKGAAALAARADRAGGGSDAKIARNLAMIENLAGKAHSAVAAADKPTPTAVAAAPKPAPVTAVEKAALPPQPVAARKAAAPSVPAPYVPKPFIHVPQAPIAPDHVAGRVPTGAPRALASIPATANSQAPTAQAVDSKQPQPRGVVMQRVPFDPLAGPVKPKAPKDASRVAKEKLVPKAEVKAADAEPVARPAPKPAAKDAAPKDSVPALRMTAAAY
jgi:Flp pilus assembly protein TadD